MRLQNVQALRFAAAILVALYHVANNYFASGGSLPTGYLRAFGFAGVDIFFVLSGFIIWRTSSEFAGGLASAAFLFRRLWRIYTAYIPAALIAGVTLYLVAYDRYASIDWFGSLTLAPMPMRYMALDVAWTLTYELYFYVLFGVMIAFRRWLFPHLLVGVALAVVAHLFYGLHTGGRVFVSDAASIAFNPLVVEFPLGCLVAHVSQTSRARYAVWLLPGAVLFFGSGVAYWHLDIGTVGLQGEAVRLLAFGVPSAMLVLGVAGLEGRVKPPPWMVRMGDASYAVYLIHKPIIWTVFLGLPLLLPWSVAPLALAGIVIALLAPVSWAYFRWIESPLLRVGKRLWRRPVAYRPVPGE